MVMKVIFLIVIVSWHSTIILTYYPYELKILKFNSKCYNHLVLLFILFQIVIDLASKVSFELVPVFF